MNAKAVALLVFGALLLLTSPFAYSQNFEITGYGGYQVNGGLDLSTTLFRRIEVGNGTNYGAIAGYLLGEHASAEFQWNHNEADTSVEPLAGGPSINLFSLQQNQYMGNILFHSASREHKLRPFILLGLGANNLSADRHGVNGTTKFAWA